MAQKRNNVTLNQATKERLKRIAAIEHMTMSGVVNRWIWLYKLPEEDEQLPKEQNLRL